jgi:hypothetical protein
MDQTPRIEGDAVAELVSECRRRGARAMELVESRLVLLSSTGEAMMVLRRTAGLGYTARGLAGTNL